MCRSVVVRHHVVSMSNARLARTNTELKSVLLLVLVTTVAVWARLDGMGASIILQDSLGPYLSAVRLDGRTHASPYGLLLLPPYWIALHAGSLWNAVAVICLHALIAPAGVVVARRVCSRGWVVPLLVSWDWP